MIIFYLDTSAFIKRYKTEDGSEFIDKLFDTLERANRVSTSFLGVLEFVSACRRLVKGKKIDAETFGDMLANFLDDVEYYYILQPLDNEVVAYAIERIMGHALRSADSIHLATALELEKTLKDLVEDFVFVAADKELCQAAEKEGLKVINPLEENASNKLLNLLNFP